MLQLLAVTEKILRPGDVELYSVTDLYQKLRASERDIRVPEAHMFLVPQYVPDERRMELYWLDLEISDPFCREEALMQKTGASRICDIPQEIVEVFDHCHITVQPPQRTVPKESFCAYLDWLLSLESAKTDIRSVFGFFDSKHLYFEVF